MPNDPLVEKINFGRFKGKSFKQVLNSKEGIEYVRWMANDVNFRNQDAKNAAKAALRAVQL